MEVDWTCSEGGFLCHRETSCELEPPGTMRNGRPRKSCRKMIEKDAATEGKTRREVKEIPGTVCWHCLGEALCSEVQQWELT